MILISFIKRNILLYFRDRISVFFSLLSTLIVLTLMIAFLDREILIPQFRFLEPV